MMLLIPPIADCGGVTLGGDGDLARIYTKRELAAFAAETRLAIHISDTTSSNLNKNSCDLPHLIDRDVVVIE